MNNNLCNIWIGNIGKYNEGKLIGKWLELPHYMNDEEFRKWLEDNVGIDEEYEEYMIFDYEYCCSALKNYTGEMSSIETLEEVADMYEDFNDMEKAIFETCLEKQICDNLLDSAYKVKKHEYITLEGDRADVIDMYINEKYGQEIAEDFINVIDEEAFVRNYLNDYTEFERGDIHGYVEFY